MHLSIGMDKNQVINLISEPDIVRGSMVDTSGHTVEVWEYNVEKKTAGSFTYAESYWLYFQNNKLTQWGKAGGWSETKSIQEVRFR